MLLPLLGSVAAGHRTIRFLFLFLFSGRFTFFGFLPGETKFVTTFWQLFDNFLTIFWPIFDNFDNFLTTFWTTFLTTFANFFDLFYFDGGSQLPQQILWNKFHIRCAYFSSNCTWSPNYSVLVKLSGLLAFSSISNTKLPWPTAAGTANCVTATAGLTGLRLL
jgi:hypothetical protein